MESLLLLALITDGLSLLEHLCNFLGNLLVVVEFVDLHLREVRPLAPKTRPKEYYLILADLNGSKLLAFDFDFCFELDDFPFLGFASLTLHIKSLNLMNILLTKINFIILLFLLQIDEWVVITNLPCWQRIFIIFVIFFLLQSSK